MRRLTLFGVALLALDCAAAFHCTRCQHEVLESDAFCPNCGAKFSHIERNDEMAVANADKPYQPPQTHQEPQTYVPPKSVDEQLSVPAGMLRGCCTIALSPMELPRSAALLEHSIMNTYRNDAANAFFGTIIGVPCATALIGAVAATSDIVVGTLDVLSFGVIGNSVWDSPYKSAWFWRRTWWKGSDYGVHDAMGW